MPSRKSRKDRLEGLHYPKDSWIFRMEEANLHELLDVMLRRDFGYDAVVYSKKEYTYAVGEIPVLLVAHMDTVHYKKPVDILYDAKAKMLWSPQGLGADDRAGVWAILALLRRGFRPHVLFTCGEERGCTGARALISKYKAPEIKFVIELDRANSDDMVFYQCANEQFEKYVGAFGFKKASGSCSDISTICPAWEIAGVNLSTGYYSQHSKEEHLKLYELARTIGRVGGMLQNIPKETFKYVKAPPIVYTNKYYKRDDEEELVGLVGYWADTRFITPAEQRWGRVDYWNAPEYKMKYWPSGYKRINPLTMEEAMKEDPYIRRGAVSVSAPPAKTTPIKQVPPAKTAPVVAWKQTGKKDEVPAPRPKEQIKVVTEKAASLADSDEPLEVCIFVDYTDVFEAADFGTRAFWKKWFHNNSEVLRTMEELTVDDIVHTIITIVKEEQLDMFDYMYPDSDKMTDEEYEYATKHMDGTLPPPPDEDEDDVHII